MDDTQQEVIAFLRDPTSYSPDVQQVEVTETHASLLFLAGRRAYKLKRAVKYSYLDFSTLALRQAACTAELKLNRRTAPELYLEVRAISRRPDGTLVWGRDGEVVDFVVVMQRFAADGLLEQVAAHGELTPPLLYALAAHIAAFHEKAEPRPNYGGAEIMRDLARTNIGILRTCRAAGFDAAQIDRIEQGVQSQIERVEALLDERRESGKVRLGHGDLHLRNICLIDGRPVLFDGIEFSKAIASIDVLYDLAFLLMDLEHRGHRREASLVFNRYLDISGGDDGLAAMPLFLAMRAVIRGHVSATMAENGWGSTDKDAAFVEAHGYLNDAEAALTPAPPRVVTIGGRSGSGKSTLAQALGAELGLRPGARVLRSDVRRKRLLATDPETPLPPGAYTPEITARVYRDLAETAATALEAGYSVVIDAVSLRPEERQSFADVAAAAKVPFTGLWLDAPHATMTERIGARRNDASDASSTVLEQQLRNDPGQLDWTRIDASGDPVATLTAARRALMH